MINGHQTSDSNFYLCMCKHTFPCGYNDLPYYQTCMDEIKEKCAPNSLRSHEKLYLCHFVTYMNCSKTSHLIGMKLSTLRNSARPARGNKMLENVILILFFVTISYRIVHSQEYMDDDHGKNVDDEAKALVSFVLVQIASQCSI